MKKIALALSLLFAGASPLAAAAGPSAAFPPAPAAHHSKAESAYLQAVDTDYAYRLTKQLIQYKSNPKLGYRTAGSKAEKKTGARIGAEMKKIGLSHIQRDGFTLDTWEFNKADLGFQTTSGKRRLAVLGGYQTTLDTKGPKRYTIVYAGKGTAKEYANLDVKGKLVLVDINQRDEWWINYPAYQAKRKGAAGIIAVQSGGYAEADPRALNTQDVCGPDDAPAFSISQADAKPLKQAIAASKSNAIPVTLDAKSIVKKNGTAYNYSGQIPGKDPHSYILLSAHYDAYFDGFQDDEAAIGMMLSIAKGMIDSGYKPEKTIIFNALAAEEWGMSDTRYDWSTGAYNQIFRLHPEWAGKAVANLNFELPAYEHQPKDYIRSVYELEPYLKTFAPTVPKVPGVYKDGVGVVSSLGTWSDDFSFSIAGVPAQRNYYPDSKFSMTHYHSQYDNDRLYNAKAMKFHQNLYGLLTMQYDKTAVVPLDFSVRMQALKETLDSPILKKAGIAHAALKRRADDVIQTARAVNAQVAAINQKYASALATGDRQRADALYAESRKLNTQLLKAFKFAQDKFVRLTWEDEPIFPHEHVQPNLAHLQGAIAELKAGRIQRALDSHIASIDNNFYAFDFDRPTFMHFTNYVTKAPASRLMWGQGRIVGQENLYDVIRSLQTKASAKQPDVRKEMRYLQNALIRQKRLAKREVTNEQINVERLHSQLQDALHANTH